MVEKYLEVYKCKFNLKYFHFVAGADEIKDGISIGRLDIKVVLPSDRTLANQGYIAIECKRINKLSRTKKKIHRKWYEQIY